MENNTIFDYEQEGKELPSKEEILQNEDEMIAGLLEAAAFKKDDNLQRKIEIRRKKYRVAEKEQPKDAQTPEVGSSV